VSTLKDKVKELAEIARSVPENLQVSCFEILLRDHLESLSGAGESQEPKASEKVSPAAIQADAGKTFEDSAKGQTDVTMADIHLKARKFMEKYSVSIAEVNNLFYKDGGDITPLYEDVKTTRMAEAQIRVTLLQALRNALVDGEFTTNVEAVRGECRDRKTLDATNFAANYKNNSSLFDFETFDRRTVSGLLTPPIVQAVSP
jgi:hypothetical protein